MRFALVAGAVLVVALLAGSAAAIEPGPASIHVTLRKVREVIDGDRLVSTFDVLNRPRYRDPIGEAVLVCVRARVQLYSCRQEFKLSRGQITSEGLVTSRAFFRLAVTGGTGYYDNVGGSMVVQSIGPASSVVVISLQGY